MKLSTSSISTGLLMFDILDNVPEVKGFAVALVGLLCDCVKFDGVIEKA